MLSDVHHSLIARKRSVWRHYNYVVVDYSASDAWKASEGTMWMPLTLSGKVARSHYSSSMDFWGGFGVIAEVFMASVLQLK